MSGSEVAVQGPPSITLLRRNQFNPEQVNLIRGTVAADCNDGELALFLETCARHELDPFIKEIWAIRWQSGKPVHTVVSKDGFLKIANRCTGPGWAGESGEFLGVRGKVVHEHDAYDWHEEMRPDGTIATIVEHRPRDADGKPTFGGRDIVTKRGPIVGSWAICRRRGHDDVFFEASAAEYDKNINAWKTHRHAMMLKVAESIVLRKAFPIAGVIGEGELERTERPSLTAVDGSGEVADINWPEDEALAAALQESFRALGYRRAKVRSLVNACASAEDFGALLGRLHAEADQAAVADEPPSGPEEPEVTDAVVVS
ncbi:MAG: RecT family recombinase [Baekduia sp.]